MAAPQQQNPRALINQFCQRVKVAQPQYVTEAVPVESALTRFVCTLTIPPIDAEGQSLGQQVYLGEGASKKAAQDAAAAEALRQLSSHPAFLAAKPYDPSLMRTLTHHVFTEQGLFRDPEMLGLAAAAVQFHDGQLPLAALAHSRALRGWAKEHGAEHLRRRRQQQQQPGPSSGAGPEASTAAAGEGDAVVAASDPAVLVQLVREELMQRQQQQDLGYAQGQEPQVALAADGLSVQLPPALVAVATPRHPAAAAGTAAPAAAASGAPNNSSSNAGNAHAGVVWEEQVDDAVAAAGGMVTVVVVPADASLPVREESIPAHGSLLSSVAPLLGCPSPAHVLQWGRVGHKVTLVADPRDGAAAAAAAGPAPRQGGQPGGAAHHRHHGDVVVAANAAAACLGGAEAAGWDTGDTGGGGGQTGTTDNAGELQVSVGDAADAADAVSPAATAAAATDGDRRRAGGTATPSHSQGSVMMPPPPPTARLAALQDERRASTAGCGGSGSLAPAPGSGTLSAAVSVTEASSGAAGPPLVGPTAYRADSTLTLAVHRGAAAMDWASDGQAEVRGPEHEPQPPPPSAAAPPTPSLPTPAAAQVSGHPAEAPSAAAPPPPLPPTGRRRPAAGASAPPSGPSSPRHTGLHPTAMTTCPEPSMYSVLYLPQPMRDGDRDVDQPSLPPVNVRATWLAGRTVYGDAVLTTCRQTPMPHVRKNHHSMKWRSYGQADMWRTVAVGFPLASYGRALHAPLLLQSLPTDYRGPAAWQGPSPQRLLEAYMAAHGPPAAATCRLEVPDMDCPGEVVARLQGCSFMGQAFEVASDPGPADVAQQQAALAALHALQRVDAATLLGGGAAPPPPLTAEVLMADAAPWTGRGPRRTSSSASLMSVEGDYEPRGQQGVGQGQGQGQAAGPGAGLAAVSRGGAAAAGDTGGGLEGGSGGGPESETEVEVVAPGLTHARRPADGALVKIAYTLRLHPSVSSRPRPPSTAAATDAQAHRLAPAGAFPDDMAEGSLKTQAAPAAAVAAGQDTGEGGDSAMAGAVVAGGKLGAVAGGGAAGGQGLLVEQCASLTLAVGHGACAAPPAVSAAIKALAVGGRARVRLSVCLEGSDPLGLFERLPAVLELQLLHATLPLPEPGAEGGAAGRGAPALFTPPLGQQRLQAVAAVLRRDNSTTLLDLGCGEGRLVEGLVLGRHGADCGGPLVEAAGVDISGSGLAAAARRLGKLRAAAAELAGLPVDGEESVPRPVRVSLFCGSAMTPQLAAPDPAAAVQPAAAVASPDDPWVGLRGVDAAAMVEVIEHLDPEPLRLVGPCVLGGLRPRTLIVTTPNWEYNAVLRSAERLGAEAAAAANSGASRREAETSQAATAGAAAPPPQPAPAAAAPWPGPPGRDGLPLRCADHRFEWTRAEFEDWCRGLAAQWGYDVSFHGIGSVDNEAQALASPQYTTSVQALGTSSNATTQGADSSLVPEPPGQATQMAVFRLRQDHSASGAAAPQGDSRVTGGQGAGGSGWELVWGPACVAAPKEELDQAADLAAATAAEGGGEACGSAGGRAAYGRGSGGGRAVAAAIAMEVAKNKLGYEPAGQKRRAGEGGALGDEESEVDGGSSAAQGVAERTGAGRGGAGAGAAGGRAAGLGPGAEAVAPSKGGSSVDQRCADREHRAVVTLQPSGARSDEGSEPNSDALDSRATKRQARAAVTRGPATGVTGVGGASGGGGGGLDGTSGECPSTDAVMVPEVVDPTALPSGAAAAGGGGARAAVEQGEVPPGSGEAWLATAQQLDDVDVDVF